MNEKKQALIIFSKPPLPGKTKSRLAADVGDVFAAELSQAMLLDILEESKKLQGVKLFLFYPPDSDPEQFSFYNDGTVTFQKQVGEDLGERMNFAIESLLCDGGFCRVMIIGSDCAGHTACTLSNAFEELERSEFVIQPAEDGGYVLVGMSQLFSSVFRGVQWGGSSVYEDTMDIVSSKDIEFSVLPVSFDVDRVEDLKKLESHVYETQTFSNTKRVLADLHRR